MGELVSFLLPSMNGGGAERVSLLLARELVRRGYDVEFVLLDMRGELLEEALGEFSVVSLKVARFRGAFLPVRRYLERRRPTVLSVSMWPLSGIACLAQRLARTETKLVVSEHNDFRMRSAKASDRVALSAFGPSIYSAASAIIAVSQGVADSLEDCGRVPQERMRVIHNPVRMPTEPMPEDPCSDREWFEAGSRRLITIGRLIPQKDQRSLIAAMPAVLAAHDARLLLLGEGRERSALQAQIDGLGLGGHVRLAGFRQDPYRYLALADLFVLPSAFEGLGNVIIEALAAGVPVVATDCMSGPRELLDGGRYGTLVPVGDPAALARAICEGLLAEHDRELLRERGRSFSVDRIADQYVDVFENC